MTNVKYARNYDSFKIKQVSLCSPKAILLHHLNKPPRMELIEFLLVEMEKIKLTGNRAD